MSPIEFPYNFISLSMNFPQEQLASATLVKTQSPLFWHFVTHEILNGPCIIYLQLQFTAKCFTRVAWTKQHSLGDMFPENLGTRTWNTAPRETCKIHQLLFFYIPDRWFLLFLVTTTKETPLNSFRFLEVWANKACPCPFYQGRILKMLRFRYFSVFPRILIWTRIKENVSSAINSSGFHIGWIECTW